MSQSEGKEHRAFKKKKNLARAFDTSFAFALMIFMIMGSATALSVEWITRSESRQ